MKAVQKTIGEAPADYNKWIAYIRKERIKINSKILKYESAK